MELPKTYEQLLAENEQLRIQLEEASETIQAIQTGQIDALVVEGRQGHELYTLKTADQTYRVFIETMHEGAVTLNEQGLILYSNSTFAAMVEQPLSSVIGSPFKQYIAADCQDSYNAFFQQSWTCSDKAEMSLSRAGDELSCLLSATPLVLDEGNCLSLILTDLTVQKETQTLLKNSNEALNRSNENLQQFAYIASHDLQEPLRKILQFGDLLKAQLTDAGNEEQTYLDRMQAAANRMSILIRDILSFSRISTQPEVSKSVSLTQIINAALADLEFRIQENNVLVEVGPLPTVEGDASQLGQLFQNLLTNAIKFRQSTIQPHIQINYHTISAAKLPAMVKPSRPAAAYYQIQVTDNGIGFEQKYTDRIFQMFQRLHGRNEFPGTGVGLAICQKVVANHGGAITAVSQPNQGATFYIYLPVES